MKQWISTTLIEPSELEGTVSGRTGGSIMFVAFSRVTGWALVYAQGTEKIEEPSELFLEPSWANAHPRKSPIIALEKPRLRKRKGKQLELDL